MDLFDEYQKIFDVEIKRAHRDSEDIHELSVIELRQRTIRKFRSSYELIGDLKKLELQHSIETSAHDSCVKNMCEFISFFSSAHILELYAVRLEKEFIQQRRNRRLFEYLKEKNQNVQSMHDWMQ